MVIDRQVRLLMELDGKGEKPETLAAKAGMDVKTARKYRRLGKLPSQVGVPHLWRTREDPFTEVWEEARGSLDLLPGVEAKTLFEHLQREYPGRFSDGQLRTFQRRVKEWRVMEPPCFILPVQGGLRSYPYTPKVDLNRYCQRVSLLKD